MSIDFTYNSATRALRGDGFSIFLKRREAQAFELLWPHRNSGSLHSVKQLSDAVYGYSVHTNSVHTLLSFLRMRIKALGLELVRHGQGYRIEHTCSSDAVRDGATTVLRARAHDVMQQLRTE